MLLIGVGVTLIVTTAVSHNIGEPLSQILYVNVAVPVKPGVGVKVTVPSGFTEGVPPIGVPMITGFDKVFDAPSGSMSFALTLITTGVFGVVVALSSPAIGLSFWLTPAGVTTTTDVAVAHNIGVPLSQTR